MTPEAERLNGWAAMLGFIAAVGAYVNYWTDNYRLVLTPISNLNRKVIH